MSVIVPVIYEIEDVQGERAATGTVHWYCSIRCRSRAIKRLDIHPPFAEGNSENSCNDNQCEMCGKQIEGLGVQNAE